MKILVIFLCLPFAYLAQTPHYGSYCRIINDEFDCLQIIDYGTNDDGSHPPVAVRYQDMDYRAVYNMNRHCYEISYDKKVIYSITVASGEYSTLYFTKAGESDSEVYELFPEVQDGYIDEESSDNDFQGIINAYFDREESDLKIDNELVNNPRHIQSREYFNQDKNSNIPYELIFSDFSNRNILNDFFLYPDKFSSDLREKIVAIGDFEDNNFESTRFYMVFDEKEQLYYLFSEEQVLLYKVKLLEDSKYMEFYNTASENLGKMRMLDMESSEGAPPNILIFGEYHLEDGTKLELRMKDDVNSEQMMIYYPSSKYGKEFLIIDELSDKQFCALPKDETKYYYEIIFDENESGVFDLIDVQTKEKVIARYDF